jgi:hypothetical protein
VLQGLQRAAAGGGGGTVVGQVDMQGDTQELESLQVPAVGETMEDPVEGQAQQEPEAQLVAEAELSQRLQVVVVDPVVGDPVVGDPVVGDPDVADPVVVLIVHCSAVALKFATVPSPQVKQEQVGLIVPELAA